MRTKKGEKSLGTLEDRVRPKSLFYLSVSLLIAYLPPDFRLFSQRENDRDVREELCVQYGAFEVA